MLLLESLAYIFRLIFHVDTSFCSFNCSFYTELALDTLYVSSVEWHTESSGCWCLLKRGVYGSGNVAQLIECLLTQSYRFHPQHYITPVWRYSLVISKLGREKQRSRRFKVILCCELSAWPVWYTWDLAEKEKDMVERSISKNFWELVLYQ